MSTPDEIDELEDKNAGLTERLKTLQEAFDSDGKRSADQIDRLTKGLEAVRGEHRAAMMFFREVEKMCHFDFGRKGRVTDPGTTDYLLAELSEPMKDLRRIQDLIVSRFKPQYEEFVKGKEGRNLMHSEVLMGVLRILEDSGLLRGGVPQVMIAVFDGPPPMHPSNPVDSLSPEKLTQLPPEPAVDEPDTDY